MFTNRPPPCASACTEVAPHCRASPACSGPGSPSLLHKHREPHRARLPERRRPAQLSLTPPCLTAAGRRPPPRYQRAAAADSTRPPIEFNKPSGLQLISTCRRTVDGDSSRELLEGRLRRRVGLDGAKIDSVLDMSQTGCFKRN